MVHKFLQFVLIALLCTGCFVSFPSPPTIQPFVETVLDGSGENKILLLEIEGEILQRSRPPLLSGPPKVGMVARVREQLNMATNDPNIKAIILMINSPGGEVTASDLIYHELLQFKKKQKIPIITNIRSVAASGGYYIAMASDHIIANPTAIIGSIGVVYTSINLSKLLNKIGVESTIYKSGKFKDMGSPLKPVTPEEGQIFQALIDSFFKKFVGIVATGRKMNPDQVIPLANGQVFTSEEAKKQNLIDEVGYFEKTLEAAKQKAKIEEATLISYSRPQEYKQNIYNQTSINPGKSLLFHLDPDWLLYQSSPRFFYLWLP